MKKITLSTARNLFLATGLLFTTSSSLIAQESCTTPATPTISGDTSICEGSDAILSASVEADDVRWYSAETNGNLLHTGSELVLEDLQENTTVWAEGVNYDTDGTIVNGGARLNPGDYTGGAAVSSASSPWGLRFTLTEDIILNSVDVFIKSEAPGVIVIQLKDEYYQVLEEVMVNTPAGNEDDPLQYTVNLDLEIPAGTNYSLVASSSPKLVRESAAYHSGFPYPLGNVGVITQGMLQDTPGAANATTYYFFYNWSFTKFEDCISNREGATITVNDIPDLPIGEENQTFTEGETLDDLDVEGTNLSWYADINGNEPLDGNTLLTDNTTYYVSQSAEGCESGLLAITVTESLGINHKNSKSFTITPVPASEFISISNIEDINNIEIYNTIGQPVKIIGAKNVQEIIYIGDLTEGVYIIQLNTASNKIIQRIIKE